MPNSFLGPRETETRKASTLKNFTNLREYSHVTKHLQFSLIKQKKKKIMHKENKTSDDTKKNSYFSLRERVAKEGKIILAMFWKMKRRSSDRQIVWDRDRESCF